MEDHRHARLRPGPLRRLTAAQAAVRPLRCPIARLFHHRLLHDDLLHAGGRTRRRHARLRHLCAARERVDRRQGARHSGGCAGHPVQLGRPQRLRLAPPVPLLQSAVRPPRRLLVHRTLALPSRPPVPRVLALGVVAGLGRQTLGGPAAAAADGRRLLGERHDSRAAAARAGWGVALCQRLLARPRRLHVWATGRPLWPSACVRRHSNLRVRGRHHPATGRGAAGRLGPRRRRQRRGPGRRPACGRRGGRRRRAV
mmetsp:Transcript_24897/g.80445  ORF Transcript_24897/g.80445 Transcript_24897/m.80445 type:complete len:255 (+) Transcript_24897:1092-1856(+)